MIAVLLPGQGSQRPGMGAPWAATPAWDIVSQLSDVTGRDISDLLVDADAETLKATRNAQLAAFSLGLVILDACRREGLDESRISAYAGHSLGEYAAVVASGALAPSAGALLVAERGEAMQRASDERPGTMAAVLGLDYQSVADACQETAADDVATDDVATDVANEVAAWVANDNAPGQVVIAGTYDGVGAASTRATELGAKRVMPLAVGGAFHSPLMQSAQGRLDRAVQATEFAKATRPVVANVDAQPHLDGWAGLLSAQLCCQVRWRESLLTLAGMGTTTFCELGPGAELSGMVKRTVVGAERLNISVPGDLARLSEQLIGS